MNKVATPRVSVLMAVHNGELFLREAIDSILGQTCDDFELVIVDDGSSDDTAAIIASYCDPRIVSLRFSQNKGVIAARSRALQAARGEYIAVMDSDDISLPERLQRQVDYLDKHPNCGVVATRVLMIDAQGASQGSWLDDQLSTTPEQICAFLPRSNCIAHSTTMLRGDLLRRYGYRCPVGVTEDYDLWLRLAAAGVTIAKLPEALVHYRLTPGSLTAQTNNRPAEYQQIRSKRHFIAGALRKGLWRTFVWQVAQSLIGDVVRLSAKKILHLFLGEWPDDNRDQLALQLNRTALIRHLALLSAVIGAWLPVTNKSGLFFFFPFFHIGGAERVHADIVGCFDGHRPWVVFTKKSTSRAFYAFFDHGAKLFNLWLFCKYLYPFSVGLAAGFINRHTNPKVFGANSLFYALLVPYLKPHVRCGDLIHAFGAGVEKFTLAAADRLDYRVVINQHTWHDLREQYAAAGRDPQLAERIIVIPNRVAVPKSFPVKQWSGPLRLLYVGRGSEEKRVHLLGRVARYCRERALPVEITLVGDVEQALEPSDRQLCQLPGFVSDAERLASLYAGAHLVVIVSSREGFPITIMEGMAYGCVPVCTAVGGIPEHIRHGTNGWLLVNDDEQSVVSSLIEAVQVLSNDRMLLQKLGESAYQYAQEQFGGTSFCEQYQRAVEGR